MPGMDWRNWDDEALEQARSIDRPLLLVLTASWCRFCRELDERVFQDPEVIELVERHYVPFRVEKDRRPDVDQRYNLGGWPTVAFLTPSGDLISGGASLSHEEVRTLVQKVAPYWHENRESIEVGVERIVAEQEEADRRRSQRQAQFSAQIVDSVANSILEAFDRRSGGFGTGQKFPHPEALDFAILHFAKSRDAASRELVEKTLTAMAESRMRDPVSGGFYRYCATRDWRQPHSEMLLETQAGLLRNYLEASQLFEREDFAQVAQGIVRFLGEVLDAGEIGGWYGSQDADDEYCSLTPEERRDRKAPRVEPTCYTPSVAMAVSSMFKAGAVLEDPSLVERAERGLNFLLEVMYSPGRGMYHYHDGHRQILGLLTDQIYTARALIHAVQFTGDNRYLEIVEELLGTIVKKQSARHGGFYDIREEQANFGSLRRRHTSLLENAVMAEVLLRMHCLTARADYLELAERTLKAFAADYPLYGYFTAGYGRAVELFFHHPIHAAIVGRRDDPAAQMMLEQARRAFVPSKVVQFLDPERDAGLIEAHGFPAEGQPATTYLRVRRASLAEIRDPDAVAQALAQAEERRTASDDRPGGG